MQEINSSETEREHFDWLSNNEKVLVMAYANHLKKGTPVSKIRDLMDKVNKIHLDNPDFHMGCVPRRGSDRADL